MKIRNTLFFLIGLALFASCSSQKYTANFEPDPNFDISEYINPDTYVKGKLFDADGKIHTLRDSTFTLPSVKGGVEALQKLVDYPQKAFQNELQGRVVLQVFVDSTGSVTNIGVAETPHPLLTIASANAVDASSFNAATLNGKPVNSLTYIPVYFRIFKGSAR